MPPGLFFGTISKVALPVDECFYYFVLCVFYFILFWISILLYSYVKLEIIFLFIIFFLLPLIPLTFYKHLSSAFVSATIMSLHFNLTMSLGGMLAPVHR